jgi:hypothetical protein
MARHRTAGAGSGSSRTRLIHPNPFRAPRILLVVLGAQPPLRPLHLVVRETEFCGQRLAGEFRRRARENGRNSVRRPGRASLTDGNYEGFCRPGNRVGLPGLHGGRCRDQTASLIVRECGAFPDELDHMRLDFPSPRGWLGFVNSACTWRRKDWLSIRKGA